MGARLQNPARLAARSLLWLLVAGWLGAYAFFGAVITPTVFQVLPSGELAGAVVARSLSMLNLYGIAAGAALGALALVLRRGWLALALPILLAGISLYSQFGVSPALAELRDAAFQGGVEAARFRFDRLHKLSVGLFGVIQVGVLILLGLHVWLDERELLRARENPGNS